MRWILVTMLALASTAGGTVKLLDLGANESRVILSNETETVLEMTVRDIELVRDSDDEPYRVALWPGSANPGFSDYLAIPGQSGVELIYEPLDSMSFDVRGLDPAGLGEIHLSDPMILRDLRLVNASVSPFRYDESSGTLWVYTDARAEVRYSGIDLTNAKTPVDRPLSEAFLPLYRSAVKNFEESRSGGIGSRRGGYLIITIDTFYNDLLPLADWKARAGWDVTVTRLSDIGSQPSASEIKHYIRDAYRYWDIPPDYVVLVGDVETEYGNIPSFQYDLQADDNQYVFLEGDDVFPEIFIGRISVRTPFEAQVVVAKTLSYERTPLVDGSDWQNKASLVAGCYYQGNVYVNTTKLTTLWIRDALLRAGMQPETLIYYQGVGGATTQDVIDAIDAGTGIVNYRGWSNWQGWHRPEFYVFHLSQLNNGERLPVMFSICCGTGDFAHINDPCLGEGWIRAGSPTNPKGGAAFFGVTDPWTHTKWNNAINIGIFEGFVTEDLRALRAVGVRGLMELVTQFPHHEQDDIWRYFHTYNVIGDPSLQMWRNVPEELNVEAPSSLSIGGSMVEVLVEDGSRAPVNGAYVCLYKDGEVHSGDVTGETGVALLSIDPSTAGEMFLTVTAPDFMPHEDTIAVEQRGLYVGLADHSLGDSQGNGDAMWNPGEDLSLDVTLENFGTSGTATGISATLRTDDPFVSFSDSVESFGDLGPGEQASSASPFEFQLLDTTPSGTVLDLELVIESGDSTWTSLIEIAVSGFEPRFVADSADDPGSDGYIDPGETGDLYLSVWNGSPDAPAVGLTGLLRCRYTGVILHDSLAEFGDMNPGDTTMNTTPFVVEVESDVTHGRSAPFDLYLFDEIGGVRMLTVRIRLGEPQTSDPTGPDVYGYWAYDHTDTDYSEAPTYDWIEIDPDHGGSGTEVPVEEDHVVSVDLPFDFMFYGENQDSLTLSLNGWIAFTQTDLFNPRNWRIPSAPGPENLVAVFWDELKDDSVGAVYYWHDTGNNRFVVEWSEVPNMFGDNPVETFEVVLYDPAHYPTATGDGELLFQYHTVNNVDSSHYFATVGIENRDHTLGLEYCYGEFYSGGAHPLEAELAIKFTPDPPDTYTTNVKEGELVSPAVPLELLQNRPNPALGFTEIGFALPDQGHVDLRLYDLTGRSVRTLASGSYGPGEHSVRFDGRDDRGLRLPPGIYFYRLGFENRFRTRKLILLN
jgi:hypothetical protein